MRVSLVSTRLIFAPELFMHPNYLCTRTIYAPELFFTGTTFLFAGGAGYLGVREADGDQVGRQHLRLQRGHHATLGEGGEEKAKTGDEEIKKIHI